MIFFWQIFTKKKSTVEVFSLLANKNDYLKNIKTSNAMKQLSFFVWSQILNTEIPTKTIQWWSPAFKTSNSKVNQSMPISEALHSPFPTSNHAKEKV